MFKSISISSLIAIFLLSACMNSENQVFVESQVINSESDMTQETTQLMVSEKTENGIEYLVKKVCPDLSLTIEQVVQAKDVHDLNPYFKEEWVKEYSSLEIQSTVSGLEESQAIDGRFLADAQTEIMKMSDPGSEINVRVQYLPNNDLKDNSEREEVFSIQVLPQRDAEYAGTKEEMNHHLQEKAINQISSDSFTEYALASVSFTINENGQVENSKILTSSSHENVDELLLNAVNSFPNWIPAIYADGSKAKQDFVLAVGDMRSCNTNLLKVCDWKLPVE